MPQKPPDLDEQGQPVTGGRPPDIPPDIDADEITITPQQMEQSSGGPTAALMAARSAPAAMRGVARFAADHASATQKVIGAGFQTAASAVGGALGGLPGAVGGAMMRGVTPTQAGIRETAGKLAGEAPEVARTAGRAVGVSNYGKEMGLKVKPTSLISTGNASRAFDSYADANGLKAPRVLDEYGKVVFGPEATPKPKAPSNAGRLVTRGAGVVGKAAGKALSAISLPINVMDAAQAMDPFRRDIAIGGSQSVPTPGNTRTDYGGDAWRQKQADMRARILAMLGLE